MWKNTREGKVNKEFSRKSITRFDIIKIYKEIVKMMSKKFSYIYYGTRCMIKNEA